MVIRYALVAMALCAGVVACSGISAGGSDNKTQKALLEKAQSLAELELARLSAAELIYRNKVYDHVYIDEDNGVRTDILMKYYRNFRGVEVLDVKHTDSLLRPIEFVIRYDYEMVGTRGELGTPTGMVQAANTVKNDYAFQVHASDSLTRVYRCDAAGACAADMAFLPRPNFWELNSWARKNGVLEVQDMTPMVGL